MTDRKQLRALSASVFVALLVVLLIPQGLSGRIVASFLLLAAAVAIFIIVKKRPILSYNTNQIIYVMTLISVVYLTLYYLSGLYFGFYKNTYSFNADTIFKVALPIVVIIVATEVIRYVVLSHIDKPSVVLIYLSCVVAEMFVYASIPSLSSLSSFLTIITGALLPAILSNLLYNYLSKRYGMYPNIIYRLLTTLYAFIIPVVSGISASLLHFLRVLLPIAIYLFIDTLYEKKRRYALKKSSIVLRIISTVLVVAALIIMSGTIMLISNQFRYGAYVVATGSMTGELNKGDIALYERYDGELISEGQVIAFERDGRITIHRVVKIEIINGEARYFTKGDANDTIDTGFVTRSEIVGLVEQRLQYLGYPTLWLRSLFKQ